MELLNKVWGYAIPLVSGLTIGAVIVSIILGIVKGKTAKIFEKINIEKIEEKAVGKGIDKLKTISFQQSIQPIAESELVKITEHANMYLEDKLRKVDEHYLNILCVLEKFSAYFDTSIAVTDTAKEELHIALCNAKSELAKAQEIKLEIEQVAEEVTEETAKIEKVRKRDKGKVIER